MKRMHLRRCDQGSILPEKKIKILLGRWFGTATSVIGQESGEVIERGSVVTLVNGNNEYIEEDLQFLVFVVW